jgi:hypothetical protein
MRHLILIVALAALPVACASPGGPESMARAAETADTDASIAYAEIASGVNAYKALPTTKPAQAATAEALKVQAWGILTQERQAYAAGRTFDPAGLRALVVQTSRLGH